MTPIAEYHLKQQIQKQKRQLENLQKELEKDQKGKLTDREKMVLHFCCSMTIAKMTGVANHKAIIEKMVENIRINRCRSLSEEDVVELLGEVEEEMVSGRNMFKYLIEETVADVKGDIPPPTYRWEDLK